MGSKNREVEYHVCEQSNVLARAFSYITRILALISIREVCVVFRKGREVPAVRVNHSYNNGPFTTASRVTKGGGGGKS